jgi:Tfp pilus assembly protein PilX
MITKLRRTHGFVLGIVIVVLFVMLAGATAIMKQTGLVERISGSLSDRSLAFQAAETALQEAERWISSTQEPFHSFNTAAFSGLPGIGIPGLYNSRVDIETAIKNGQVITAGNNAVNPVANSSPNPDLHRQPSYVIELRSYSCINAEKEALFEIQAQGWGKNAVTSVTLISKVRRVIPCPVLGAGADSGPPI